MNSCSQYCFLNHHPFYYSIYNFIKYKEMQRQSVVKKHKNSQIVSINKSPYYASVRRKSKMMMANQALSITKLHSNDTENTNLGENKKKKHFKRINKFQQMQAYYGEENKNYLGSKEKIIRKEQPTYKSSPKDIVISSKTLDIIDKYRSYKSIHLSTPKFSSKDKSVNKNKKFRMKVRSGNSLSSEENVLKQVPNKKGEENAVYDDWLCKELIANEVYGTYDDDDLI